MTPDEIIEELRNTDRFYRNRIRTKRLDDGRTYMMVMIELARTSKGRKQIEELIPDFDPDTVKWFQSIIRLGTQQENVAIIEHKIAQRAKANKVRRERRNASVFKNNRNLTKSFKSEYPGLAKYWDYENNNQEDGEQILPEYVAPKASVVCKFWCDKGHKYANRLDSLVNKYLRDETSICPYCNGSRQRAINKFRGSLKDFTDALNDNLEAWNYLPPAARYALLAAHGDFVGTDFQKSTALALATGDVTLSELFSTNKAENLSIDESLDSDETETHHVIHEDQVAKVTHDGVALTSEERISNIMSAAGVGDLANENEELENLIVHESIIALWNEVHDDESNVADILSRVALAVQESKFRERVANLFLAEVRAAQSMVLPENWNRDNYDPSLMQRRFTIKAVDERRVLNMSGTGQGKTVAGILAIAKDNAQKTLVVCPANTVQQWTNEVRKCLSQVKVYMGLPGHEVQDSNIPQVWVVSHNAFSQDNEDTRERIARLAGNLDAVILDEVHRINKKDGTVTSNRRSMMEQFMDENRETNPEMLIIAQSATPIITDLSEVKELLALIDGEAPFNFQTKPTIKNMMSAHRILSQRGIRYIPSQKPRTIKDVPIDITSQTPEIIKSVETLMKGRTAVHPSVMEQALLPFKLPTLAKEIRKVDSPVVIYVKYTTGIVEPMRDYLTAEGFKVGLFTGAQSEAEKAEVKNNFENGKLDVLIGSDAIATGVDGLQHTCHDMVIASLPNTAAEDEQICGRVDRKGQEHLVNITYLMTYATIGNGTHWSYCEGRKNRILFRRSQADAVVDGIVSRGDVLESEIEAASRALALLKSSCS